MDSYRKYLILAALVVLVFGVLWFWGGRSEEAPTEVRVSPSPSVSATITPSPQGQEVMEGLTIEDLTLGIGEEAVAGKTVTVNYLGTLTDGKKFDSSYDRGTPFTFNLGAGEVIKGWDAGVAGMKVGGKRKLTIAPHLGYGARGAGDVIPPNATLIFEVELLKVE